MLDDSKALLEESTEMLFEIKTIYRKSLDKRMIPNSLRIKIKNLLENIRSALDYPANHIFDTYCAHNFSAEKVEKKRSRIYFPIRKTKAAFDTCMEDDFKGLSSTRPDIVDILEKNQSFNTTNWLETLNYLSNSNKHRSLALQERTVKDRVIQIGGITMINPTFGNNGMGDIIIGDKVINMDQDNLPIETHPDMKSYARIEFVFKELNVPVIGALTEILEKSIILINDLDRTMR